MLLALMGLGFMAVGVVVYYLYGRPRSGVGS